MGSYPICLNLKNEICVVIGGGRVALRKTVTLAKEGAHVIVVSPELCYEMEQLAKDKVFQWEKMSYQEHYLQDAFLVIAATDSRKVNSSIAAFCRAHHILVNVVDAPEESTFTVNSFFQRGDLLIAVSTGGKAPAISKRIREELEERFGQEYETALNIAGEMRKEALEKIEDKDQRREFLQELARWDLPRMLCEDSEDAVRDKVKKCLLSYLD